jgi:ribonucleotide monophosphatase NagD (HAD superfamily)
MGPKPYKAIYAAVIAALSGLVTVLVGDIGFSDLTAGQWVTIALAALVAGGGTYGISNQPTK